MSREEFTDHTSYEALIRARTEVTGFGGDVGTTTCCPFCCEPGVLSWKIMTMEQTLSQPVVCPSCARGMRTVFSRTPNGMRMEFVQTSGPDLDPTMDWLPKIRRE